MKNLYLALAGSALTLAGCGSPNLPTTATPVITTPTSHICGSSASSQFCDQSITSPAPSQRLNAVAIPGANGVADCDYSGSSEDTTRIDATVYLPAFNQGDTFPVILHSHGWGGARASTPATEHPPASENTFRGLDFVIPTIVNAGYIVISFDERGWGTSEGEALVMNPCYETVDAMAVVDWAIANLPVDTSDGDIVLGAIGGSYGGAYQLMLAAMDDRLDAMVPVATWNQLASFDNPLEPGPTIVDASKMHGALITNEALKRGYTNGLCLLAGPPPAGAGARLDPLVQAACDTVQRQQAANGQDMDNFDPAFRELFGKNGLGRISELRAGRPPMDVDVWLVQGNRDMVFDVVEAYDNYEIFTNATHNSGEARLMTMDAGHMLTTFALIQNSADPSSNYQVARDNDCGEHNMFDLLVPWFDERLKGFRQATPVPDLCLGLNSDEGITAHSQMPVGSSLGSYTIPATNVTSASATNTDLVGSPLQFLAVATMPTDGYFAGIPVLNSLKVDAIASATGVVIPTVSDATAMFAVGIQKPDGSFVEVDEQVAGVRRANTITDPAVTYDNLRMPFVGEPVANGDKIGLLLYQRNGHFQLVPGTTAEHSTNAYQISGNIQLPLFDSANNPIKP
ncbi:MAG: hypothetical protein OXT49_07610 [Gammaproteobacteria bacterium]|nr:hypothetical protein [Gammaproteobacteria bacterium]